MRALVRKLIRHLQHHSEGSSAERKRLFFLDHNDLSDLRQYVQAVNNKILRDICGEQGGLHNYSYSDIRQLCKPLKSVEVFRIAAFWINQEAMSKDAAYGAILGAFSGDAAGGVLEFMPKASSKQVWGSLPLKGCSSLFEDVPG